jgi:outer membrane protein assembly factor BamB
MKKIYTLLCWALSCSLMTLQAQSFPSVQWSYDVGAPAFGSAASADFDDDGKLEIVFTTYTNDGRAHCLNAEDGSIHWIYDIGGCGDVAPLIYDADNDDTLDVIINGSCNPTAFCINGQTGVLKWSVPSGGGDSPPTAADIDGDGMPEILFGNFNGQVRILNGEDGSLYRNIQVATGAVQTEPTLCDVDADGQLDFIVANHFNITGCYTYAFNPRTGDTLWVNFMADTASTYYAYHGGALADIDFDGKEEYVIGANNGTIRALNVEDGSVLWTRSGLTSVMSAITIADMDGDDTLEVIYNNNDYVNFNDHIGILNGPDGNLEWDYPLVFTGFRGMSVSDVNGNGKLDMVLGVYMGGFMAVEAYTGLLWATDLDVYFQSGLPWFDVNHGPLIADFDGDDTIEVFTVAGYGTYTPDSMNCGKAFMLNAGTGHCPSWLMFRHDAKRTGYISNTEINEWCDTTTNIAVVATSTEIELSVMPNPFNAEIQFSFNLAEAEHIRLEIIDLQGRVVGIIADELAPAGTSFYQWQSQSLPSGLYFYRLSSNAWSKTGKIIKVD